MQLWIGTCGYSYTDWVGAFYPPGTSADRMFSYYVRQFPLVELNYTFYRPPTRANMARLARLSPQGFQFIVKLHQEFSHQHHLAGAAEFGSAMEAIQQEGRLLALLCQYPQQFHFTSQNLQRLETLADQFAGYSLAFEFRHRTWHNPGVIDWLRQRQLHIVSVDVPDIPNLFPRVLVQSSRLIYIRLHSRRKDAWYTDDKSRYDYLFSDQEMLEWLEALAKAEGKADKALLLFNNCFSSQAALNALRVKELLTQLKTPLEVVEPPEWQEDSRQRLLF
jgi:uncharacterized protein YecE (DUF72 family)